MKYASSKPPFDLTFQPVVTNVLTQEELDSEILEPVVKGEMFEETVVCYKCRVPLKMKDTILFRGKRYGISCGCSQDINKLIKGGK